MIVTIPYIEQHAGYNHNLLTVLISDYCPVCGGARGTLAKGLSYDGSRRLVVDVWANPCEHIDKYEKVRREHRRRMNFTHRHRGKFWFSKDNETMI